MANNITPTVFTLPPTVTPAQLLFALAVVGVSKDERVPYSLRMSAHWTFYGLTEKSRSRGIRNRTKLDAHARYGRYTAGAQRQFEAAVAVLTPDEVRDAVASDRALARWLHASPTRTAEGVSP